MERLIKDYFLVTVLLLLNYIDEVVDSGFNVMGFVPILLLGIYNYSIYKTTTHRSARSEIEISDDYSYDVVKKAFKWDPGSLISSPVFIYTLLLGCRTFTGRTTKESCDILFYSICCLLFDGSIFACAKMENRKS